MAGLISRDMTEEIFGKQHFRRNANGSFEKIVDSNPGRTAGGIPVVTLEEFYEKVQEESQIISSKNS